MHSSLRFSPSRPFLPLLVLLFLCTVAHPQPLSFCPNVCRRKSLNARRDCVRAAARGQTCYFQPCVRPRGNAGFICSSSPPPSPSPSPVHRCRNRCRQFRRAAKRDCRLAADRGSVCFLRRCDNSNSGWICSSTQQSATPSPSPRPQGCPNVCRRFRGTARRDCGTARKFLFRCEVVSCDVPYSGELAPGWRCQNAPSITPTPTHSSASTPTRTPSPSFLPPTACPDTCRRRERRALRDCTSTARFGLQCVATRCTRGDGLIGWKCGAQPSASVSSTVSASTSATASASVTVTVSSSGSASTSLSFSLSISATPSATNSLLSSTSPTATYSPSTTASTSASVTLSSSPSASASMSVSVSVFPSSSPAAAVADAPVAATPTASPTVSRMPTISASSSVSTSIPVAGDPADATPSTSPTMSVTPTASTPPLSVSPSASPSATVSSGDGDTGSVAQAVQFRTTTAVSGLRNTTGKADATDGSGTVFDVTVNSSMASVGVTSLSPLENDTIITCSLNGRVRIQYGPTIPVGPLDVMYTIGSALVLDRDRFPGCIVFEDAPVPGESAEEEANRVLGDNSNLFSDTVIYIESFTGTPRDHTIVGKRGTFLSIFEELDVDMTVDEQATATNRRLLLAKADNESDLNGLHHLERVTAAGSLSRSDRVGVFGLSLTGTATATADAQGFRFRVSWRRFNLFFDMGLTLTFQTSLSLTAAINLATGSGSSSKTAELFSVPVFGTPVVVIGDKRLLPSLRTGLYSEAALFMEVSAKIDKSMSMSSTLSWSSAKTKLMLTARGPLGSISFNRNIQTISTSTKSSSFSPPSLGNEFAEVQFNIFAGVRPRLAFYVADISATKMFANVGLEGSAIARVPRDNAFPPATGGSTFGDCGVCHHMQLSATFKATGVGIESKLSLDAEIDIGFTTIDVSFEVMLFKSDIPSTPAFERQLGKGCLIKQYGDDQELCSGKQFCCNEAEEQKCPESGAEQTCQATPSPSLSSTPSPTCTCGTESSCYTDPHIRTFDRLSYDCQALGEFTMAKSDTHEFEMQARFNGPNTGGTVNVGVVVKTKSSPAVQISVASSDSDPLSTRINGCPINLYVNGKQRTLSSGTGINSASLLTNGRRITLAFSNRVRVGFSIYNSALFGCYMESLQTFIPDEITSAGDVRGILGTPNKNPFDDWTTRDGTPITVPTTRNGKLFEEAYNYCTTNWCIANEADSLFSYDEGTSFEQFNKCNLPYGQEPDLSNASQELRALCGDNAACLIDGLFGGIDDARNALVVEADQDEIVQTNFRFSPASIRVDSRVRIRVTLDLEDSNDANVQNVERFNVYFANESTGFIQSASLVSLQDRGVGVDLFAEDLTFSGTFRIVSFRAGETFSFRAIPVIGGNEQSASSLAQFALNAITSFSLQSGLGSQATNEADDTVSVRTLLGVELLAEYSWESTFAQLDTSTRFLDENVGFGCPSNEQSTFTTFGGQNDSLIGIETAVIQIEQALIAGGWSIDPELEQTSTSVRFHAGWHGITLLETARLRVVLRSRDTGEEVPGTEFSSVIFPGGQLGCASTFVATWRIADDFEGGYVMSFTSPSQFEFEGPFPSFAPLADFEVADPHM